MGVIERCPWAALRCQVELRRRLARAPTWAPTPSPSGLSWRRPSVRSAPSPQTPPRTNALTT